MMMNKNKWKTHLKNKRTEKLFAQMDNIAGYLTFRNLASYI